MRQFYFGRAVLTLVLGFGAFTSLFAAKITVTSTADNGSGTFRGAVMAARSGDTIVFAPGTNGRSITLRSVVYIEKDLVILGNGMRSTMLNGSGTNRAFSVRKGASVTAKDLRVFNGVMQIGGGLRVRAGSTLVLERVRIDNNRSNGVRSGQGGGGIFNQGVLSLMDCMVTENTALRGMGSGGGILNGPGGALSIMSSQITSNEANRAGGGIEDASGSGSAFTIMNSKIDKNTVYDAPGNGGGIHIGGDGSLTITGGTVNDNRAGAEGGGIWNGTGTLTVVGTEVRSNTAAGNDADQGGGGLYNNGGGTIAVSGGARISGNQATGTSGSGGGILNNTGATLMVMNSRVEKNVANRAGGGIEDASGRASTFTITDATINENRVNDAPGNGGGIHIGGDGNLTITGSKVNRNQAGAEGGGIWNGAGTLTVGQTIIQRNTAAGDEADQGGGGLYNNGSGTILLQDGTQILDNRATGTSGSGGGILNNVGSTLTIANSRVKGNVANRAGGGIEDVSGAATSFTITDSRIEDNQVNNAPGNGGGIHIGSDGDLTISGGMVSRNRAGAEGGGIWNGMGTLRVMGTVVRDNSAAGNDPDQGGGGLYNNGGGTIALSGGAMVKDNQATGTSGSGGGILNNEGATLTITDSRIETNEANRAGGGIEDVSGSASAFTITNSKVDKNKVNNAPGNGGGIHIGGDGNLTITGGTVNTNRAGSEGGGIWNNSGTLTVMGTQIRNNSAAGHDPDQGGGGLYNNGGGTIAITEGTEISGNQATGTSGSGGGILNNTDATLTIADSRIDNNVANRAGGGIEDASGSASAFTLTNTMITNNRVNNAPGNGGGVHVGGDGNTTVTGGIVSGNQAGREGGGLWNGSGTMELSGVVVTDNSAAGNASNHGGGGLFNVRGNLVLEDVTVSSNRATGTSGSGGGLLSLDGMITVSGGLFDSNSANRAGGGVEIVDGSFSSTNVNYTKNDAGSAPGNGGAFHVTGMASTIDFMGGSATSNVAANEGGGLWNQAGTMMAITNMSLLYNRVTDPGSFTTRVGGGGVFNNGGILDIDASTIAYNTATGGKLTGGGGIANNTGGTITLMRSTVSNNAAGLAGGGIGNDGTMEIINSTITANMAPGGGGFAQARSVAKLTIMGTIVADNMAQISPDFGTLKGMVTSNGYNLIGDDTYDQFPAQPTDMEGMSAMLMALADNGGTTMTHAPKCSSPVVNAGDPDDNTPDQIGQSVFGDIRDIGSFEKQSFCGPAVQPALAAAKASVQPLDRVQAYPNPVTNDFMKVTMPAHFAGEVTLRIISPEGRVRQLLASDATNYRLELGEFAPGAYTLQVINGEETQTVRFVIVR